MFNISLCDQIEFAPRRANCRGEGSVKPDRLAGYRRGLAIAYGWPIANQEQKAPPAPPPKPLCGTALANLLASLGQHKTIDPLGQPTCSCQHLAGEMDRNGPDWCREHRDEIAAQIKAAANARGWAAKLAAGAMAIRAGIAHRIDLADLYGWLVDEAIEIAIRTE